MIPRLWFQWMAVVAREAAASLRARGAALRQAYRRLSVFEKLGAWGSAASVVGLALALPVSFPHPAGVPREALRPKLLEYVEELDAIEAEWAAEHRRVEPLAGRAASLLAEDYPQAAKEISSAAASAATTKDIAVVLRQEIDKVLDQIDTETK